MKTQHQFSLVLMLVRGNIWDVGGITVTRLSQYTIGALPLTGTFLLLVSQRNRDFDDCPMTFYFYIFYFLNFFSCTFGMQEKRNDWSN